MGDHRSRAARRANPTVAQCDGCGAELRPAGGVRGNGRRDARARRRRGPVARAAAARAQRHGRLAGRRGSVLPVPRARRRTSTRLDALRRRHRDAARLGGRAGLAGCVGSERCGRRVRARPERYERRTTPRGAGVQSLLGPPAPGGTHGARRVLPLGGDTRRCVRGRCMGFAVRDDQSLAHRARWADVSGARCEPRAVALRPRRGVESGRLVRGSRRGTRRGEARLGIAQCDRSVVAARAAAHRAARPLRDHGERGIPRRRGGRGSQRWRGARLAAGAHDVRLGAVGGAGVARASQARVRSAARRAGELVRTALAGVLLVLGAAAVVVVRPLAAQLPDAEAAFKRGDYRAARAAYERALAADSTNVRALYQLAILDSWDGKLGRSLERLGRVRRLASHADDAELLIGLAQTLYWKGQPALAEGYAARARVLAPQDRSVLELEWELRAAVRPSVRTTVDGAGDSDGNTFVAQEAYYEASLSTAVRGTLRAGWRRASFDTVAAGSSFGVGGQISAPLGAKAAVQVGLGVRRLDPDSGRATTPLTAALGLPLRPGRYVAGGIRYRPAPVDETAALLARGLVVDALDLGVDISPSPRWAGFAGGGGAWAS